MRASGVDSARSPPPSPCARESRRVLTLKAYAGFAASQVAGLVANTATVVIASYFMPVLVGKLLAIGASFLVNFSLSHFVVFRKHADAPPRGRQPGA